VQLVISDAHAGLRGAIDAVLLGAAWQRCRVHFVRNVLARVPKGSAEMVAAAIRTVFAQPDAATVRAQSRGQTARRRGRGVPQPKALERLAGAVLAEQHDEWQVAERRYLSEGSMTELTGNPTGTSEPVAVLALNPA